MSETEASNQKTRAPEQSAGEQSAGEQSAGEQSAGEQSAGELSGRPDKFVTACMIIIGNEILSGRTRDANLAHLAVALNEYGVRLKEARVIPDEMDVIVATVNECRKTFDYVFTTGGIGPTHDDITADAVAKAFGVSLELNEEAAALLRGQEAPPEVIEARLRMARVPKGGTLIPNPVSRAPGFQIENVFVMAGVPQVMQVMVKELESRLDGGRPMRARAVTVHLGESVVSKPLRAIQDRYPHIDIGSYPFYRRNTFGTSLVMRGTDEEALEALAGEIKNMIRALGGEPIDGEPE